MKTKNHSRKISLLVAVLILLAGIFIGGYLVLNSVNVSAGQLDDILKGVNFNPNNCEPDAADADKDSDNDGLRDWQEIQIYQSDPCKTDTDNDGYLDGEEITSGYNPVIKAPGDELPGTTPKGPRPLPENLTKALSSALAQQIATGKIESFNQNGQILSASELAGYPAIQQSVQQLLLAGNQLFAPEIIDASQIKTADNNSPAAIQSYAAQAAAALAYEEDPAIQASASEAAMFQKVMENNDFTELNFRLNNLRVAYDNLKILTVPTELAPLHKEQLSIFSSMIKVYEAIRSLETDPLKTNLALQKYQELSAQFSAWIEKLGRFIEEHQ